MISYYNPTTDEWKKIYVVEEKENAFTYLHPSCVYWAGYLQKMSELQKINPVIIKEPLKNCIYKKITSQTMVFFPSYLNSFSVDEEDFKELNTLILFFLSVEIGKKQFVFSSLEEAIHRYESLFLNKDVLKKAICYLFDHFDAKKERLKCLQYPRILNYIKS